MTGPMPSRYLTKAEKEVPLLLHVVKKQHQLHSSKVATKQLLMRLRPKRRADEYHWKIVPDSTKRVKLDNGGQKMKFGQSMNDLAVRQIKTGKQDEVHN